MARDNTTFLLIIISSIFQCVFFDCVSSECSPFAFAYGLNQVKDMSGVLYLEICALSMPIYFISLFFSDYYSHYFENYGQLLMIRNCRKSKMISFVYLKITTRLGLFLVLQLGINLAWFSYNDLSTDTFLKSIILYFLLMLALIALEFYLCTFVRGNIAHFIINMYIWTSFLVHWICKSNILKKIFLPGKMLFAKKDVCDNGDLLMDEYIQCIVIIVVTYIATVYRCRKKDIY